MYLINASHKLWCRAYRLAKSHSSVFMSSKVKVLPLPKYPHASNSPSDKASMPLTSQARPLAKIRQQGYIRMVYKYACRV
jgi:hypothetical protein